MSPSPHLPFPLASVAVLRPPNFETIPPSLRLQALRFCLLSVLLPPLVILESPRI